MAEVYRVNNISITWDFDVKAYSSSRLCNCGYIVEQYSKYPVEIDVVSLANYTVTVVHTCIIC